VTDFLILHRDIFFTEKESLRSLSRFPAAAPSFRIRGFSDVVLPVPCKFSDPSSFSIFYPLLTQTLSFRRLSYRRFFLPLHVPVDLVGSRTLSPPLASQESTLWRNSRVYSVRFRFLLLLLSFLYNSLFPDCVIFSFSPVHRLPPPRETRLGCLSFFCGVFFFSF